MSGDDDLTDLPWIASPEEMRAVVKAAARRIRRDRTRRLRREHRGH